MPGLFALLLRAKTGLESYCMDLSPLTPKMFTWFLSTPSWWQQCTTTIQRPASLPWAGRCIPDTGHTSGELSGKAVTPLRLPPESGPVLNQVRQADGRHSCTLGWGLHTEPCCWPPLDSAVCCGCGLTQGPIFGGMGLISNFLAFSTVFISAKHCGC